MEDKKAGSEQEPKDISWTNAPRIVASGVCMGTADVVPGVSGGTMAVALGIYVQLLAAIASINARSIRGLLSLRWNEVFGVIHFRFLISLTLGILLAVIVMLRVVRLPYLLETQPTLVYAVFFGLVLASTLVLMRHIPSWTGLRVSVLALGALVGFLVVNLVPVNTPENPLFIFLCGVVAISAMLLPGISGSFVLLILGKYEYIIGQVEELLHLKLSALLVVLPFALGCLVGIAAFSRLLSWVLRNWHDTAIAGLTGLLLGSLWRIWPYQHLVRTQVRGKSKVIEATPFWPESIDGAVIGLAVFGLAVVLVIEQLARRRAASAAERQDRPGEAA